MNSSLDDLKEQIDLLAKGKELPFDFNLEKEVLKELLNYTTERSKNNLCSLGWKGDERPLRCGYEPIIKKIKKILESPFYSNRREITVSKKLYQSSLQDVVNIAKSNGLNLDEVYLTVEKEYERWDPEPSYYACMQYKREETNYECTYRLKHEESYRQHLEEKEREEYERLSKKYSK